MYGIEVRENYWENCSEKGEAEEALRNAKQVRQPAREFIEERGVKTVIIFFASISSDSTIDKHSKAPIITGLTGISFRWRLKR